MILFDLGFVTFLPTTNLSLFDGPPYDFLAPEVSPASFGIRIDFFEIWRYKDKQSNKIQSEKTLDLNIRAGRCCFIKKN